MTGGDLVTVGLRFPRGPPRDGQTVGLGKKGFGMRCMLNVSGGDGPVGFVVKMIGHFCPICVKLLMDEALRMIWPEGKSHAEPQRLIWSGGLHVEGVGIALKA